MEREEELFAKKELESSIKRYYGQVDPEAFIDGWVIVVHKESITLTAENRSEISINMPNDQAFHETIGMLTIALDARRSALWRRG